MREKVFLDQGAVTVEVHTQLINYLRKSEGGKSIRNHPSIHATPIISIMKVTVGNQERASDVDQMIILLQIFRNRTLWIRKFSWTHKILKLVHTDQRK